MLRSKWMGTLALVLALTMVVPAGVVYAAPAPATTADGIFALNGVFDCVLEWLVGWGGGAAAKAGIMINPNLPPGAHPPPQSRPPQPRARLPVFQPAA